MSIENIIRDIKKKEVKPIYFLSGEEAYYIDYISDFIEENLIPEEDRTLNQFILYGKDVDLEKVMSLAKEYPMGECQLFIFKEAQDIKNFDSLELYLKKPQPATVLVFCYKGKSLDKRKALPKTIDKMGVLFESKKLYDNQVPDWIVKYVEAKGFKISPKASVLLSEFLGNELSKITNEIDKLCILLPSGSVISPEVIEKNVGISKDYNIFELNNALGNRDFEKVMRIVHYFAANPKNNPLVVVLSTLHGYFLKVMTYHFSPDKNPDTLATAMKVSKFFIKDYQLAAKNYPPKKISQIFELLNEYDLKSKGVNNPSTSEGELLKELVYKMMR